MLALSSCDWSIIGVWKSCRYLISQHPEVEARLAAELDEAGLLVTPERPQPRDLTHADLSRLTYLNCVLKVRQKPHL